MITDERVQPDDPIASALSRYAQNVLVVIFGLLPLIFFPTVTAPFDYTKVFVVVIGLFIALVLYSLSVLRSGALSVGVSYPLLALWGVVGITALSSLLSGDFKDSFIGDLFSIHSTAFVVILALIPTVWILLKSSKTSVMRMYILFSVSTLVLVIYHLLRLKFGQDFFAFGVFTNSVSTSVGSWNDLALFLGLIVILSLIALDQITLTKIGKILFASVTFLSLLMLSVINFFMVWLILGLTSLVMIVYSLGKERFSGNQLSFSSIAPTVNTASLASAIFVFVTSAFFVIGGATIGGAIAKYTNVSYVEVRPSFEATANIARDVYHENAFLGIGANKFTDAWRMYKDNAINVTPFWNTEFNAGNSYLMTFFVTTGVFGGIAWIIFLLTFLITGIRRLLSLSDSDRMWYFIGISSFVSALYIWGMSVVYVPGVVILLLGALCTGVSLSAFSVLDSRPSRIISVGANRRSGFILTLVVIIVIIGSVSILYITGRHYSAVYAFNESIVQMQQKKSIDELERQVESAYKLSSSDIFARRIAEYQFARLNGIIGSIMAQPSADEIAQLQADLQSVSILGINAAQEAVKIDSQEPANWSVLGNIYSILAVLGVGGAKEEALKAFNKAHDLDPKNPIHYLEMALVTGRTGETEVARAFVAHAIELKPNYTEAFFFLSQLEIEAQNIEAAITSTQSTITLDPQNPARHYQLGVLESAQGNLDNAIASFERAIALDTNFANARYLLALAYDTKGRSADAKAQLETVLTLNPGNTDVLVLLNELKTKGSLQGLREAQNQTAPIVNEGTPVTDENGTVSTTQNSDTKLITPVNTVPKVDAETTVTQ